jgi:hypothetical protein
MEKKVRNLNTVLVVIPIFIGKSTSTSIKTKQHNPLEINLDG